MAESTPCDDSGKCDGKEKSDQTEYNHIGPSFFVEKRFHPPFHHLLPCFPAAAATPKAQPN